MKSAQMVANYLNSTSLTWEIIIVDDGGHDFPQDWKQEGISLITLPENRGKGAAVKRGMEAATGKVQIYTDADMPFDRELIPVIVHYILNHGYHLVIGDRTLPTSIYQTDITPLRKFASFILTAFVGRFISGRLSDTQCGLKDYAQISQMSYFALVAFSVSLSILNLSTLP